MKTTVLFSFLITTSILSCAQTSPSSVPGVLTSASLKVSALGDTITFAPYAQGTIITNQYLNNGVIFSGYNGSTDPDIWDYGTGSYGRILKSDTWYNALRMNFVDSSNAAQYRLAQRIEFDNPVGVTEVDYMSIDVYDSMNVLIYHYLSASPEHVVINFASPSAAYLTIDDSSMTAYIVDNILVDFGNATSVNEIAIDNFKIYPSPFSDKLNISETGNEQSEIILYDIFSREVLNKAFTNTLSINTGQLSKGIYFYEVRSKNRVIKKGKVVKE